MTTYKTSLVFFTLTLFGLSASATNYVEDFNDGLAQDWQPQVRSQWSVGGDSPSQELVYRASAKPSFSGGMVTTLSNQKYSNLEYSADIRKISGGNYATYIIFRASKDFMSTSAGVGIYKGSGYAFGFHCVNNTTPSFFIYKMQNDVNTKIIGWVPMPVEVQKGCTDYYNYKVQASGKLLHFYINDVLVYSYKDPTPVRSGRIGLLGYSRTESVTQHAFDNLRVTDFTITTTMAKPSYSQKGEITAIESIDFEGSSIPQK